MRLYDLSAQRCEFIRSCIARISAETVVDIGPPTAQGMDILINASPVGMLEDARLPLQVQTLPSDLVVFDAIVMPEQTPLLALAERCACTVVRGREMMLGLALALDVMGGALGTNRLGGAVCTGGVDHFRSGHGADPVRGGRS
ncbi:MAG: hypothetical protein ACKOCZ_07610 [Betaproteobacteria bacterium]